MLDCAHSHPGLACFVYSSALVGSTSYFIVYAEVASQVENRQGRELERGGGGGSTVLYGTSKPTSESFHGVAQHRTRIDTRAASTALSLADILALDKTTVALGHMLQLAVKRACHT